MATKRQMIVVSSWTAVRTSFKDRGRQDHRLGDDQFDYLIGIVELPALLGSKAQFRAELDHKSTMPEASLSVSSVSRPPSVSSYACVRLRD